MAKSDYESDELLDSEEDYELESEDEYEEYGQDEDDEEVIPKRRGRPLIEEAVVQDVGKRRRAAPRTYREPTEDELPYSEDLDESADGSSASTDLARMTERQRAKYMEAADEDSERQASSELLELTNERSKKKQFTEEELQLRRLENARKRKNFTMKRLEMEKQDTLNKLLLKRADKVRNLKNLEGKEYGDEEPAPAEAPRRPVLVHPAFCSPPHIASVGGGCIKKQNRAVEFSYGSPDSRHLWGDRVLRPARPVRPGQKVFCARTTAGLRSAGGAVRQNRRRQRIGGETDIRVYGARQRVHGEQARGGVAGVRPGFCEKLHRAERSGDFSRGHRVRVGHVALQQKTCRADQHRARRQPPARDCGGV
ncbi:hypothetical protein KL911_001481 [Ogataea haglerorum]|uniref:uncharacterized protein n=1 Tax=Ogataea haglerorum TaxID=1937702 RepID=UPI001C893213|nr:uncharacterized protein KL911_001481 [Ogataea haglerorum]KAG7742452.1 hypothetical protein KL923_000067 [Ogataea haglerorum]KAG7756679.1 hypothetical protein KL911_001481 [Ogataea haglerorum]